MIDNTDNISLDTVTTHQVIHSLDQSPIGVIHPTSRETINPTYSSSKVIKLSESHLNHPLGISPPEPSVIAHFARFISHEGRGCQCTEGRSLELPTE